jgi:hypothetical protein
MSPRPRLTRVGVVVIAILVVCGVLVVVGGGSVRFLAFAIACVTLLALAGEGMSSGLGGAGDASRKRDVLRRQARPRITGKDPVAPQDDRPPDSGLVPRRRRELD